MKRWIEIQGACLNAPAKAQKAQRFGAGGRWPIIDLNHGEILYRATLSDRSQAIIKAKVPWNF
jgi:hypothetical protein